MAIFLEKDLDYLFPDVIRKSIIKANRLSVEVGKDQLLDSRITQHLLVSNPENHIFAKELHQDVRKALKVLKPRDEKIIAMRFGLNGYEPMSTTEIADKVKLTRARVAAIEKSSLRKLCHPKLTNLKKKWMEHE